MTFSLRVFAPSPFFLAGSDDRGVLLSPVLVVQLIRPQLPTAPMVPAGQLLVFVRIEDSIPGLHHALFKRIVFVDIAAARA